jgi:aldehyde dehydrogenase (NAD+)
MAPRRLFASASIREQLLPLLIRALRPLEPIEVSSETRQMLGDLIAEATLYGAKVALNGMDTRCTHSQAATVGATILTEAHPSMRITQADIFAPLLSVITVKNEDEAVEMHRECPYALTASVFGPRRAARVMASRLNAGTVLVNDVIVSTADPRVAFGGRKRSGFGSTRGAEGLLEMTAVKTVVVQRSRSRRSYQPTTPTHSRFFAAYIRLAHGRGWRSRLAAFCELFQSARQLR